MRPASGWGWTLLGGLVSVLLGAMARGGAKGGSTTGRSDGVSHRGDT